jgi:DNA invertase Pin-like site-specific DNA recombinase
MNVGYARVSTLDQTLALQEDALHNADCKQVFKDIISGAKVERPGLQKALDYVREGDTLIVWRLDRLGRSLQHLIETVQGLEARGVGFKSLTEQIDTTTPSGKLVFHIFAALAQFERDLIRERTQAGLEAARARGRKGGRPGLQGRLDPKQVQAALRLYDGKQTPVGEICKMLKVSRAAFYKRVLPEGRRQFPHG